MKVLQQLSIGTQPLRAATIAGAANRAAPSRACSAMRRLSSSSASTRSSASATAAGS